MEKSVLLPSLSSTTTNNNKNLKKATKTEVPKVNMNKSAVKTQIYNSVFVPDLQSLTYDAAIAWLLFLALNPFTGWFWAPLVFNWA
jgi:hypothetical protein